MVSASEVIIVILFQAEDGMRDWSVTGVQTCALPISRLQQDLDRLSHRVVRGEDEILLQPREFRLLEYLMKHAGQVVKIGRASCRERGWRAGESGTSEKKVTR